MIVIESLKGGQSSSPRILDVRLVKSAKPLSATSRTTGARSESSRGKDDDNDDEEDEDEEVKEEDKYVTQGTIELPIKTATHPDVDAMRGWNLSAEQRKRILLEQERHRREQEIRQQQSELYCIMQELQREEDERRRQTAEAAAQEAERIPKVEEEEEERKKAIAQKRKVEEEGEAKQTAKQQEENLKRHPWLVLFGPGADPSATRTVSELKSAILKFVMKNKVVPMPDVKLVRAVGDLVHEFDVDGDDVVGAHDIDWRIAKGLMVCFFFSFIFLFFIFIFSITKFVVYRLEFHRVVEAKLATDVCGHGTAEIANYTASSDNGYQIRQHIVYVSANSDVE